MIENNGNKKVVLSYEELIDIAQSYRELKQKYAELEAEIMELKHNGAPLTHNNSNNNHNNNANQNSVVINGKRYDSLNEFIADATLPVRVRKKYFAKVMAKRYSFLWFYKHPELAQTYQKIGLNDFGADVRELREGTER